MVNVIRDSLLLLAFTVTTAAQPLQIGPATRVAPFTAGASGSDYQGSVVPRANGFVDYWLLEGELWTGSLAGSPPRPDPSTVHSIGLADAVAETVNGPIILDRDGQSASVRLVQAPESAPTPVGTGYPDAIECNLARCLVSTDSGNTIAVVDTNAQLVKMLAPAPVAFRRLAWAADPDGFLILMTSASGDHAIRIDNSGSIIADVKVDRFNTPAATFNAGRYAVFDSSASGLTAFTMTVDGQVSSPKTTIAATTMQPEAVAWNGSEYLLAGPSNPIYPFPEEIPPNAISGLRIAPDLTPIGTPFLITPSDGAANHPTSIAWNGSMFYVVWTRTLGSPSTVYPVSSAVEGAAISPSGDVVTRDLQSWGSIPQTWPHVAQGASSTLVVWSEFDIQSGTPQLRYARNGNAFTAATGYAVDVVPIGDDYLVNWEDSERARAAIVSADGKWSEVILPAFNYTNTFIAANRDHWLIAGSMGTNVVTVVIARDGAASPPTIVEQTPYLHGLASDGERFFLAAQHNFILDSGGSPIIEKQPHGSALEVDFSGGVYGAFSGVGTVDRYDRDGNFIGSTKYAQANGTPALSHIGSRFVIVDPYSFETALATIVASDGTLVASGVPGPDVIIAKSAGTQSSALETRYAPNAVNGETQALFVEPVSIVPPPAHRAVRH